MHSLDSKHTSVSVIIPAFHFVKSLEKVINSVESQTILPNQIIVIDSSNNNEVKKMIDSYKSSVGIIYKSVSKAYPGEARNLGIKLSSQKWVAFLDSKTVPNHNWLEEYLQIIKNESAEVVFGVTKYVAKTEFQNLLKAAIYGDNGVETTPGTLIMRDTSLKLGGFIEGVRTSDDLEWRERVRRNGLKCITPKEFSLTYSDISNSIYLNIKRFFLYQLHTASIDVQNKMKDIHLAFFLLLSALVIPRWNAIVGWKESLFYIPDVTKIYLLSLTSIFALKLLIDNLFRKKESSFIFSPFLKTIVFIVLTMMVINWNYAIAKWEEDALLYIPHITKFYVLFLLTSSLLYRGIYFPIKNGIAVSYLFPFKWIKVGLLGLALDIVKAPGYIFGAILYPYKKHRD
jgi:glycosyltransferase involved in cell wall biosynthesis